jgi:DNA-binding transcriptional MerR regulator
LNKAPDAFRTISEVAVELDLPQHVLRFWETRFPQIRPMKRGGGRRYYRPEDVDLLRGIRRLLYADGYTVRGVQRILREQGVRMVQSAGQGPPPEPAQDGRSAPKTAPAVDPEPALAAVQPPRRDRPGVEMDHSEPDHAEADQGEPDRDEPEGLEMESRDPDRAKMDGGAALAAATAAKEPHYHPGDEVAAEAAQQSAAAAIISSDGDTRLDGAVTASLDLERLKAALAELEACRRLLDGAVDDE